MSKSSKSAATIAARAGGFVDNASGGVVPPMQPSTTFIRDQEYELVNPENSYGRDHNDQVRLAENVICQLEEGAETLVFASGMAAISNLVTGLKRGDTLLLQSGLYWGTTAQIRSFCAHREINLIEADSCDIEEFREQIISIGPEMVFVEVPSNPWIRVCDIEAISKAVKEVGATFVVDATAATPILLKPLSLGADFVMHSATKAINGHSDVLAGVLTCRDPGHPFWLHAKKERHGSGAILSAQSAWMLIRGMRTLPLRVERMCANAIQIAEFLNTHNNVQEVWYPGLVGHQDHALAKQQMLGGFGYLMSFLVKGGRRQALDFCRHLSGIHRATSLGGTESLVEHRHTVEGDLTGCPENLIRLSVGIEDCADLIAEIGTALDKVKG
ncbi:MAG: PLP-dependent transferase [Pseudomonadota bacterium]